MAFRPLTRGRSYWRTVPHVPADVTSALRLTVRTLEEAESLPGPDDVRDLIPPSMPCWRRRIAASAWWVFYELRDDGTVVLGWVVIPAW